MAKTKQQQESWNEMLRFMNNEIYWYENEVFVEYVQLLCASAGNNFPEEKAEDADICFEEYIVEQYKLGKSMRVLSKEFGYSVDYVRLKLIDLGVHKEEKKKSVNETRDKKIIKMYEFGVRPIEIAKRMNLSATTIYGVTSRYKKQIKENSK